MTRKIYKSAMGKTVDLGALLLQNENIRAVGNMNVNARGDRLDSANRIIEPKNRQVQRQYKKQTNVSAGPTHSSTVAAKQEQPNPMVDPEDTFTDLPVDDPVDTPDPVTTSPSIPAGGLAGAIARSREIKQELEKTARQQQQQKGVRKI